MNRPHYTDYVTHVAKFYSRNLYKDTFANPVDKANWWSCHNVISRYSIRDKNILLYIFGEYDTIADNIYQASVQYGLQQDIIWTLVKKFQKQVAIERGLI